MLTSTYLASSCLSNIPILFNSLLSSKNYILTASNLEYCIYPNHIIQTCDPKSSQSALLNVIIKFVLVKRRHSIRTVFL